MAIFWIILGITVSIWSATFPLGGLQDVGPGFFPLVTGLILTALGIIMFFHSARRRENPPRPPQSLVPHRAAAMRVLFCLAGMTMCAAVFEPFGFVLSIFLMVLFMMRAIEPQKWSVALSFSIISALGSFFVFKVLLKTSLPRGLLGF